MLILFATLNAMDGVCCPDGCTHEQQSPWQQDEPEAADGVCLLCLGGVDSSVPQELAPSGFLSESVGPPRFAQYLDALSDPVEHPPRS